MATKQPRSKKAVAKAAPVAPPATPPAPPVDMGAQAERERKLILLLRNQAMPYLDKKNVTSVGVGYKYIEKENRYTDELCIQFTVGKKVAPESLAAERLDLLPESFTDDDGTVVSTDVIERKYDVRVVLVEPTAPEAASGALRRKRPMRPMRPGISVANVNESAGTIGGFVFDEVTAAPYILSNWHVLHGSGGNFGDPVLQPGPYDGGDLFTSRVGALVRSHLGLGGDCAVASIEGRPFDPSIFETNVTPKRIGKVNLGDKLVKSGRTTGVTYGIVRRVGVVTNIDYGGDTGNAQVGGFEIGPNAAKPAKNGEISSGGDSGAFWMVDDAALSDVVVGLHFAGETDPEPAAEHALACNIHSVLEKLRVRLAPTGAELAAPLGAAAVVAAPMGGVAEVPAAPQAVVDGDLPALTAESLAGLQRQFDADPAGLTRRMRRVFDSEMTEDTLRSALDRARRALLNPAAAQSLAASREAVAEALPAGFTFPGMDPSIPINPEDHKYEEAGDLLRWIVFGGSGVLLPGDKHEPYPRHGSFGSRFVYPMPDGTLDMAMFSDFGTARYHSLYIAKQIREANLPFAFHLGDVYYAGRKGEFQQNFIAPLSPMLAGTELFMLNSNHEMYSGGKWYFDFMDRKRAGFGGRQRQEGSYFAVRNGRFQILGIDTDYHDSSRLADQVQKDWLSARLAEGRALGLANILVSANQPYEYGRDRVTSLYDDDLRDVIGSNVDLWFWGNNHYCALFQRGDSFPFVGSCVGHAGFPYTRKRGGQTSPAPLLFLETRARFPESTGIRQDMGNNGWCRMRLNGNGTVDLTYIDWMGNVRCRASLSGSPLRVTGIDATD